MDELWYKSPHPNPNSVVPVTPSEQVDDKGYLTRTHTLTLHGQK